MNLDYSFFITSVLLGFGLAMDAFSVSLANGLNEPKMTFGRMSYVAGVYGFFQFIMPVIGWFCVHTIINLFSKVQRFIPWIAFILLLYIGGEMLLEAFKNSKEEVDERVKKLGFGKLMVQGIATSIDALSVGFTISEYTTSAALIASAIIAVVTFIICISGLHIGKKFGTKLSAKAGILGGIILIGIGTKILISGILG